jgi:hypothetical protein
MATRHYVTCTDRLLPYSLQQQLSYTPDRGCEVSFKIRPPDLWERNPGIHQHEGGWAPQTGCMFRRRQKCLALATNRAATLNFLSTAYKIIVTHNCQSIRSLSCISSYMFRLTYRAIFRLVFRVVGALKVTRFRFTIAVKVFVVILYTITKIKSRRDNLHTEYQT